jgi:hypothetical protein
MYENLIYHPPSPTLHPRDIVTYIVLLTDRSLRVTLLTG